MARSGVARRGDERATAFTPGPWWVVENLASLTVRAGDKSVATLSLGWNKRNAPRAWADARLMAAAPEMFDLLLDVLFWARLQDRFSPELERRIRDIISQTGGLQ